MPRLRELSWKRIPSAQAGVAGSPDEDQSTIQETQILSPIKGSVARWGEGIRENARVEKGDLIAELENLDSELVDRLKIQSVESAEQVDAAERIIRSVENQRDALQTNVPAYESQISVFEQTAEQRLSSAVQAVAAAKLKVKAADAERDELAAAMELAEAELERAKTLFEKKSISELELQQAETKVKQAEAKLRKAETQIQEAENVLQTKWSEQTAVQADGKAKVHAASLELNKARAELAKLEGDLVRAELDYTNAQRAEHVAQRQLANQSKLKIVAPVAGIVTNLADDQAILKEGDTICVLVPLPRDGETLSETTTIP